MTSNATPTYNMEEVNRCKNCDAMRYLNAEGYCGRCATPAGDELDNLRKDLSASFESFRTTPFETYASATPVASHAAADLFIARFLAWHEAALDRSKLEARIDELTYIRAFAGQPYAMSDINDRPLSIQERIAELKAALTHQEPQDV